MDWVWSMEGDMFCFVNVNFYCVALECLGVCVVAIFQRINFSILRFVLFFFFFFFFFFSAVDLQAKAVIWMTSLLIYDDEVVSFIHYLHFISILLRILSLRDWLFTRMLWLVYQYLHHSWKRMLYLL